MKKMRYSIFSLGMVLLLAACNGNNNTPKESSQPAGDASSEPPVNEAFTLIAPENTTMVTANVKAYVDAMREQEESLEDPYKYDDLGGENGVNIDEGKKADSERLYLDTGDVNGKNQTVNGQIPNRSDRNTGVELQFDVAEGHEAETYKVLVADNEDFENAKELETTGDYVNVKNLFVNTKYYWKVVTDTEESDVATFETDNYPRWITCRAPNADDGRGIYNVRDMGGYMTKSGKRVKQGLVYRGGEITTMSSSGHYNTITDTAKKAFREDMGMVGGVELDLRGASDIGDGYKACGFAKNGDIEYKQYAIKSYEQTFTNTREMVAPIFEILKEADQKPVYYHCFGGADRTGTLGFLLNGLLGVSYTDLVIDFELTSYSSINNEHIRCHIPGYQHQYDRWPALINQLKTDTTGGYAYDENALLMDNIYNFLNKACSVPTDTLDTIRDIMLEDQSS